MVMHPLVSLRVSTQACGYCGAGPSLLCSAIAGSIYAGERGNA